MDWTQLTQNQPNTSLSAQVPYLKFKIFVRNLLYIESNCGYCCDDLAYLQPIQDCSFTRTIQAQNQNSHFPGTKQATKVANQTP